MSAPTPAPGDDRPREGYYPDPSIPGYVRYWNGTSWVPGTSRPAPPQGESPSATASEGATAEPRPSAPEPAQVSGPVHAPVDETGPVYLDEEPNGGNRPEPSSAWQADASRQTGFGGERDHRVSWGGTGQPGAAPAQGERADTAGRAPVDRSASAGQVAADPRTPAAQDPTGGALPGMRGGDSQAPESTVTIRAVGRAGRPPRPRDTEQDSADGTMTIRAVGPGPTPQSAAPAQAPRPAQAPAPSPAPAPAPVTPAPANPLTPGPGGGAASWAQQAHPLAAPSQAAHPQPQQQLPPHQQQRPQRQPQQPVGAQPGPPDGPVVPWKPPVNDHFQQLAQAQAAARPAGLAKRFAARLVDTIVLGALVGAIAFPLVSRAMDHIGDKIDAAKLSGETVTVWLVDSTTAGLFGGALGVFLVLGVVLEALPTAKWGRTLGKKLCGLEVKDIESHGPPSFGAALRRWLVHGVLGLLVIGVVNVMWCLFDRPWRQCWHDKAARTFVAG
ncbi:RDD family protein [Streptomyces sp. NPDC058231]|uniref:RDD family protein n=1 Tax=Streptomyces sp. NPDC058231 TaxID=3346392 RepID=UPI0036ECE367